VSNWLRRLIGSGEELVPSPRPVALDPPPLPGVVAWALTAMLLTDLLPEETDSLLLEPIPSAMAGPASPANRLGGASRRR
jgi:hypothetical protein